MDGNIFFIYLDAIFEKIITDYKANSFAELNILQINNLYYF